MKWKIKPCSKSELTQFNRSQQATAKIREMSHNVISLLSHITPSFTATYSTYMYLSNLSPPVSLETEARQPH